MSYYGAEVILVIMILRIFVISKLPKKTFIVLWGVAICRLMIPYSFSSKFSIFNVINSFSSSKEFSSPEKVFTVNRVEVINNIDAASQKAFTIPVMDICWGIGVLLLATFFIVAFYKSYGQLRTALPIKNNLSINEWINKQKLHRNLKVMVSDQITTPLACGVIFPKIILPKCMKLENKEQLNYVLAHELIHIKHFHTLWKCVMLLVLCIHWFNPLVWFMYVLLSRDLEISCDEEVIEMYGETKRSEYASYLINMAEQRSRLNPLSSGFSKNSIEERLVLIMKYKKLKSLNIGLACMVVGVTTNIFATTGAFAEVKNVQANNETTQAGSTVDNGPNFPAYTASDFEKCVEKFKNVMTENIKAGKIKSADIEKYKTNMKEMEDALERLKADSGKGNFVVDKIEDDVAEWQTKDGHYICAGMIDGVVSFGTDEEKPTETYTVQEFEKYIETCKNRISADIKSGVVYGDDYNEVKELEDALEKLKADNGQGKFVVYKSLNGGAEWDAGNGVYIFN